MLPEGWRQCRFGDIATFRNGLNFTRADSGEAIKIVGVADFQQRSELTDTSGLGTIRVADVVADSDLLKDGDLLFVRSNGAKDLVGRCLYFPRVTERLAFSGFTIRARVETSVVSAEFAVNLMRSDFVREQMRRAGGGTNINNLSQEILSNLVVPIPPRDEQAKIAQLLSTWDKAIATTERLLASAEKQKSGIVKVLLISRVDSEQGSGQHKVLGELVEIRYGRSPEQVKVIAGTYPIVGTGGKIGTSGRYLVDHPTLVIGRKGSISVPQYVEANCWPIDTTFYCVPKKGCDLKWLYHRLSSIDLRAYNEASGVPSLSRSTLEAIHLRVPELSRQRSIADILDSADLHMQLLREGINRLQVEKRALMSQLLTGKRRVRLSAPAEAAA